MDSTEQRLRSFIRDVFSVSDREVDENVAHEVEDDALTLMRKYTHAPRHQREAIYAAAEKRILNRLGVKEEPSWSAVFSEKPKPIPEGYHSITPYLIVDGAVGALEYYKKAFGATELFRMEHQGKIGHAEMKIGDSPFMLADEYPEMGYRGPKSLGGSPIGLVIYVEDCDTIYKQAIEGGGTEINPLQDQFYGDRSGTLTDPFGHIWIVATHKEDVTPEELKQRIESANASSA